MTEREPKCLFCGKPKSSGKRFIGGGGAIICDAASSRTKT